MATQICPKCKSDNFTWYINEEESEMTIWQCYTCAYKAFENEADERQCLKCHKKTEYKLRDSETEYWWCSTCNIINFITE